MGSCSSRVHELLLLKARKHMRRNSQLLQVATVLAFNVD